MDDHVSYYNLLLYIKRHMGEVATACINTPNYDSSELWHNKSSNYSIHTYLIYTGKTTVTRIIRCTLTTIYVQVAYFFITIIWIWHGVTIGNSILFNRVLTYLIIIKKVCGLDNHSKVFSIVRINSSHWVNNKILVRTKIKFELTVTI